MTVTDDRATFQPDNVSPTTATTQLLAAPFKEGVAPILFELGYVRGWQHGHYAAHRLYHLLGTASAEGGR